jgi:hypothetical protein
VQLVISDAHEGLKAAIEAVLTGAAWQRCRTHAMRNLLTKVPKASQSMVATLVPTIFEQPDGEQVWAQHAGVVAQLEGRFSDVATMLVDMAPDLLGFTAFPVEHWTAIRSNNPQERLNKELRRRTDVVGIFPNRGSVIRLVGAVLAEQHDEWAVARRYMSAESLAKARLWLITNDEQEDLPELGAYRPRGLAAVRTPPCDVGLSGRCLLRPMGRARLRRRWASWRRGGRAGGNGRRCVSREGRRWARGQRRGRAGGDGRRCVGRQRRRWPSWQRRGRAGGDRRWCVGRQRRRWSSWQR